MMKLFQDRQLSPKPAAIDFALRHVDRSFAAVGELVARLDARALAEHREITRDLVREALDKPQSETH